jgi:hypothetical protein
MHERTEKMRESDLFLHIIIDLKLQFRATWLILGWCASNNYISDDRYRLEADFEDHTFVEGRSEDNFVELRVQPLRVEAL